MKVRILYATTSGSTRFVVDALVEELGPDNVDAYDIAVLAEPICFRKCELIVLVTPTYGTGDWHPGWEEKGEMLKAWLPSGSRVALLSLGNSRCHKVSFAGGIAKLAALARSKNAELVGSVSAAEYNFVSSPAVEKGMFPGLIVEYRRDRHFATNRARAWIGRLQTRQYLRPGGLLRPPISLGFVAAAFPETNGRSPTLTWACILAIILIFG